MNKNRQMKDLPARERILQDLDTTFLVEAGAGSGKTTSLVGRMISLIQTGKAEAGNIAAITFTNKAASELGVRFRAKLEQALESQVSEPERKRLNQAVQDMNQCFIGTIHAFCGRLLRERPLEAKVDPAFRELDEKAAAEFRNQCWDEYLEDLRLNGKDSDIEQLAGFGIDVEDLRVVYQKVSLYQDVHIYTDQAGYPDFDVIRLSLIPMIQQAAPYIPVCQPEKDWDALQKAVLTAGRQLKLADMTDDMELLRLAGLFNRSLEVTQNRWTDKTQAKIWKEKFLEWQTTVLFPFLEAWQEFLHPRLIEFVKPAVDYCTKRRQEEGILDFQDLLLKAAELLRDHEDVRRYFARKYTRLFIDEFQDTDPIQAEMMMLLTGENMSESNWKKQVPKAGSLFIVGDPKQSIYRFRRADISTYNFVKQQIIRFGEVLELTTNFRSIHAIGDFVNQTFRSKFTSAEDSTEVQAKFVRMNTVQPNPADPRAQHGVFTLSIPKVERDKKSGIAEQDAERIAQTIAWACRGQLMIQEHDGRTGRPAVPSDFMILLKHREFIRLYAEKLEKYGIPSETAGRRIHSEEISALYQLTQFLHDPADQIALLAVLRGMFFGMSDNELFYYKLEAGSLSFHSLPKPHQLSSESMAVFLALKKLETYAGWVHALPGAAALYKIVADLGLIPFAAAGDAGDTRSGSLVKLIQLVQQDPSLSADWSALTFCLGRLTEADGMEAAGLLAGTRNAVRIMNLHKAKGLEAPVVFLACPCGSSSHDIEEHVDRMSDPAQGYFTISKPRNTFQREWIGRPAGWAALAEKEREYLLAEEERLLYVAATRPRQLLIVSRYPSKPAIDPWSPMSQETSQCPELEPVDLGSVERETLTKPVDVEQALERWNGWLKKGSHPTYRKTAVTDKEEFSGIVLKHPQHGRGRVFGEVVHRCIEAAGNGLRLEDLEDFAAVKAEETGLAPDLLPDVLNLLNRLLKSSFWQRSRRAAKRLYEVPFMKKTADTRGTEYIKGVIDLLFEEEDGWVVVDFKTDRLDPRDQPLVMGRYIPQVTAYRQYLEQALNCRVKEAGLYFLDQDSYVTVND